MVTISKLTVANAKAIDATNWLAMRDVFGPQQIPDPSPRGDCVVQADTLPFNNAAEWSQIAWSGGEPVPGKPNQRRVSRHSIGTATIAASVGMSTQKLALWTMWADMSVLTKGPRPPQAKPWSEGVPFPGPDQCGAYEVQAFSMGKNARGQIIAVAKLLPRGVGRVISAAGKHTLFNIRRELTAHDYVDGAPHKHKKSFGVWLDDTLLTMQVHTSAALDELYDTDAPDLPVATQTAETYNNFRQWLEWDGRPCSNYAYWYFQARWKDQKVTLKDVGQGSIALPQQAFYKKP
ncbi:MAG: hypothetical protein GEV13_22095 [Rhodospirillales bacterium]|nr:hypothetical protein [Rhodospirillales bacterium]